MSGLVQDGEGFSGASACPPGSHSKARVIQIVQAMPPPRPKACGYMVQFMERSPEGPLLPLWLHSVSPRITGRKKYCVTYTSNNVEDDFETWKNVYYVSEKNKTPKAK